MASPGSDSSAAYRSPAGFSLCSGTSQLDSPAPNAASEHTKPSLQHIFGSRGSPAAPSMIRSRPQAQGALNDMTNLLMSDTDTDTSYSPQKRTSSACW